MFCRLEKKKIKIKIVYSDCMNKDHSLDDFFHFVSRLLFVVPIVMILFALLIKFSLTNPQLKDKKQIFPSPTQTVTKTASLSAKLNLRGPFQCHFDNKDASLSAYIKDRKIFLTSDGKTQNQNVLL